jgi:hypothetical protein
MSLLTTASTWINDTNTKRQSTMRKTIKLKPNIEDHDEYVSQSENYQNLQPEKIEQSQNTLHERNERVNELLNKITALDKDNDNDKMGNFVPIINPTLSVKKDMNDDTQHISQYSTSIANSQKTGPYKANDTPSGVYSNYKQSYEAPTRLQFPYSQSSMPMSDDRLIEKINYMIHLLEEQQVEKTSNITEEFILYTFLGVFIIFVADSFARSGKYIR